MQLVSKVVEPDSLFKLIRKAIIRKHLPLNQFESFGLRFTNVQPNERAICQFQKLFGCNELPVSYMFIFAFRYLGQLFVSSNIPSKLMGMIHLTTSFRVIHPHDWSQPTDIDIRIISHSENEQGISYLVSTQLYQFGQATLVNENTFLDKESRYRSKRGEMNNAIPNVTALARQQFTPSVARHYAKVSGDYNPIHLHSLLAKFFGMSSSVMHGMYGVHWLLTHENVDKVVLQNDLNVQFNRPCYLPKEVVLTKFNNENSYALFSTEFEDRFMKLNFT